MKAFAFLVSRARVRNLDEVDEMSKILLVPSNDTQVRTFEPVCRILTKNDVHQICAISLDAYKSENAEKVLCKAKIPYRNIEDYGTKNVVEILRKEKADIIIVGNDAAPIEKSFAVAGNFLGIPTLLIQDGLIGEASFSVKGPLQVIRNMKEPLRWMKKYTFLVTTLVAISREPFRAVYIVANTLKKIAYTHNYGSAGCTKIAVAGNYVKRVLIRQGIPPERIVVTGNPRFDVLNTKQFNKGVFSSELGNARTKKIITLCTESFVEYRIWTKEKRKQFLFSIINAISELPYVQFVIKLHPRETINDYKEILSGIETNSRILLYKDVDLYGLISVSDIIMTVLSTTALEAMILDKPVIIVDFFNESKRMPYAGSDAVIVASNPGDIVPAIKDLLYNKESRRKIAEARKTFVYENAYKIDGEASQRIADLIRQTIEDQRSARLLTEGRA